MRKQPIQNMAASVRARLLNFAKARRQPFDLVLTRYALERLLYRLSTTKHGDRFVLKGAMLMTTWFDDPYRPTRDLDLAGTGNPDPEAMIAIFREICAVKADDGIIFDVDGLEIDRIREDSEYGGLRIKTTANIDRARIRILIDIAFGDAIEPGVEEIELPVLLDLPPPRMRVYPRETVIAEKFQAMVALGRANGRMKDFYDVWVLSRAFEFKDNKLARAIAATFGRRKTEIPAESPDALTPAFAEDPAKVQQWNSFVADLGFQPGTLAGVVKSLSAFLMRHARAARAIRQETPSSGIDVKGVC